MRIGLFAVVVLLLRVVVVVVEEKQTDKPQTSGRQQCSRKR